MKTLFLAMLCVPAVACAQTYSYNKLISTRRGSDNFNFDNRYCANISGGLIEVEKDTLRIDGRKYILKPLRRKNMFKAKKCSFEFLYRNQRLAAIRQFQYNDVLDYVVDEKAPFMVNR